MKLTDDRAWLQQAVNGVFIFWHLIKHLWGWVPSILILSIFIEGEVVFFISTFLCGILAGAANHWGTKLKKWATNKQNLTQGENK